MVKQHGSDWTMAPDSALGLTRTGPSPAPLHPPRGHPAFSSFSLRYRASGSSLNQQNNTNMKKKKTMSTNYLRLKWIQNHSEGEHTDSECSRGGVCNISNTTYLALSDLARGRVHKDWPASLLPPLCDLLLRLQLDSLCTRGVTLGKNNTCNL